MKTLRSRVLLGTTVAVALVLALAGWSLYTLVERALVGEVDRALAAQSRVLASSVTQIGDTLELEFTEFELDEFASPGRGEFIQVWVRGYRLYQHAAQKDLAYEPNPTSEDLTSDWIELDTGSRGRVVTYSFQPPYKEPKDKKKEDDGDEDDDDDRDEEVVATQGPGIRHERVNLVMAGDASGVVQALAALKAVLGIVGLLTLASAGAALSFVVRRSLQPVGAVSDRVAAIGEENLSTRLDPAGVPGELLPVVQRVNELLARLETAFERERAFSNDVAHELRTPLAGLRATLEVTAKRPRSAPEYAVALNESADLVRQLQAMVEHLLQLARLDGGRPPVDSEPYSIGDAAVEAWEPFAAQALARGLRVDLDVTNGVDVRADRELVEVILRNVYENAVTYADRGGHVRIATRRNGHGITLEVSNTGSRIGEAELSEVTQRFWRGDEARTEAGLHCGLGLSLVEKATAALDGRMALRSRAGGEFAVEVTLPC